MNAPDRRHSRPICCEHQFANNGLRSSRHWTSVVTASQSWSIITRPKN